MTLLRFPGGRPKVLTLSYDDGVRDDLQMCEILNKYGLKCTFNVNSANFLKAENGNSYYLTFAEAKQAYSSGGHEVACHGYMHEYLNMLPASNTAYEVIRDRETLEREFDTIIRGFAYPYSAYNDDVVAALKSCGIVYARGGNDSNDFSLPEDFMRMRPTVRHARSQLMELANKFLTQKVVYAPIMFMLMGHTYEFSRANNWNVIEEFAELMGNKEDIWYATCIEIYEYVEAYKNLVWSADMKRVYNPTQIEIWLKQNNESCSVPPGKTLKF